MSNSEGVAMMPGMVWGVLGGFLISLIGITLILGGIKAVVEREMDEHDEEDPEAVRYTHRGKGAVVGGAFMVAMGVGAIAFAVYVFLNVK